MLDRLTVKDLEEDVDEACERLINARSVLDGPVGDSKTFCERLLRVRKELAKVDSAIALLEEIFEDEDLFEDEEIFKDAEPNTNALDARDALLQLASSAIRVRIKHVQSHINVFEAALLEKSNMTAEGVT